MRYKPGMKLGLLGACLLSWVAACGGKVPAQSAQARGIVLSDDPPPIGYLHVGELSVKSGKGCGVLGEAGSREGAEALLRNEAEKLGAGYVQLTRYEAPRPNHQCLEHEHKLSGVAYRALGALPARPGSTGSATPPSAPKERCTPGATQACLGPGACQGAQACRDDASGFLPCDCGAPSP